MYLACQGPLGLVPPGEINSIHLVPRLARAAFASRPLFVSTCLPLADVRGRGESMPSARIPRDSTKYVRIAAGGLVTIRQWHNGLLHNAGLTFLSVPRMTGELIHSTSLCAGFVEYADRAISYGYLT
jgi:hypothetical protein